MKRILVVGLFVCLCFPLGALAESTEPDDRSLEERIAELREKFEPMMVPMRDGVHLATDVVFPEGEGPWPCVLVRTPYNKNQLTEHAFAFLEGGMACAAQDMRGFFASEGDLSIPFIDDGWLWKQDGYDSVEWLSKQSWCDGRVVTVGASALGITQYLMAATNPPGLVAQHIELAPVSLYHGAAHPGGPARQSLLDAWLPGRGFEDTVRRLITGWERYDIIWQQFDATTRESEVHTPAMHWVGWFDQFRDSNIEGYVSRQYRGGEGARGTQYMVIGPWVHRHPWAQTQGEMTFPESAATHPWWNTQDQDKMRMEYFREVLANGPELKDRKKVAYYLMGDVDDEDAPGNEWIQTDEWPVESTERTLYLTDDHRLSNEPTRGKDTWLTLNHDPDNPTETLGGANEHIPAGVFDQRQISGHPDAHVFTSNVLEEPLTITGMVKLAVKFKSDAPDCDIAVRLCDVYPDGRSMLILDGIQRAVYRNGFASISPLLPFRTYDMTVNVGNIAIAFNAGHRIEVIVSTTNAPRFGPNRARSWLGSSKTKVDLRLDTVDGLRLILPVVEN
ncbi:MAG: CocE/NonD family hydrolase [Planctomycetes bacterium]|nr:CocE/NonD family hydrolase [Planctomycetota bacterium]